MRFLFFSVETPVKTADDTFGQPPPPLTVAWPLPTGLCDRDVTVPTQRLPLDAGCFVLFLFLCLFWVL